MIYDLCSIYLVSAWNRVKSVLSIIMIWDVCLCQLKTNNECFYTPYLR